MLQKRAYIHVPYSLYKKDKYFTLVWHTGRCVEVEWPHCWKQHEWTEVFPVFAEATAKQEIICFVTKKGCVAFIGYDKNIEEDVDLKIQLYVFSLLHTSKCTDCLYSGAKKKAVS